MVDKNAFFREHYAYAREAGLSDVQARLAVAQAAVETGWGTKGKAVKGNNFFGMKTGANWSGKSINLPTEEETQGGKRYTVNADFRQYANPVDAYRDWKSTMETNWPGVMQASTFNQAVAELDNGVKGRYATAKAYPASLKAVNVDLEKSGVPKQVEQQIATAIPDGAGFAFGDPAANAGPAGYTYGDLAPPTRVETSRVPAQTDGGGLLAVADVRGVPNASVLDTLHPAFQDRAKAFFAEAARRGIGVAPVAQSGGYRSKAQQAAIASTGVIAASPGRSYHNLGLSFDYAPVDANNKPVWDKADPRWGQARALAQEMGLEQPIAGDLGHVQLANFPTKVPDALLGAPRFDVAGRSYPQLDPTAQLDVAGGYGPYAHHYEESLAAAPLGTVERAPLPDVSTAVADNGGFPPGLAPASYAPDETPSTQANPFADVPAFSKPMGGGLIGGAASQPFSPPDVARGLQLASLAPMGQETRPSPFGETPAFSAPMAGGMIGSSIGQDFKPANVSRAVELASLPAATSPALPDISGIQKALDVTRSVADMGQPGGGTMYSMADTINAQPSPGIADHRRAPGLFGVPATFGQQTAALGTQQPGFNLPGIAPVATPATEQPLATPADFPAAPPTPTEKKHPVRDAAKRAAIGGALFGLPGAVIGAASSLFGGEGGFGSGLFDGPGPIDKFSVGSGIRGMERAMSGARGATARASNGSEYTSLGPGMGGIRTSGKYGWSEMVGPDGSTRAGGNARGLFGGLSDAFNAGGGLLGDRPGGLGGLFGGIGLGGLFGGGEGNRGGFSRAERDKYGGRAGLW